MRGQLSKRPTFDTMGRRSGTSTGRAVTERKVSFSKVMTFLLHAVNAATNRARLRTPIVLLDFHFRLYGAVVNSLCGMHSQEARYRCRAPEHVRVNASSMPPTSFFGARAIRA